jgi:putative hemolysin
MHRLVIITAVLMTAIVVPTLNAKARDLTAYRHYSRAQFVNMSARYCKPKGGNAAFCCRCNGGVWTGKVCS